MKRGTEITLHLKKDAGNFLERDKLEEIVKKHSEFVNFPIYIWSEKIVSESVENEEASDGPDVQDVTDDEEKKTKTLTKTIHEWKLINDNKPIWTRPASEITKEEYHNFYKAHFKESTDPLAYNHFKLEGENRFTALIYIPSSPPVCSSDTNSSPNSFNLMRHPFETCNYSFVASLLVMN